MVGQLMPQRSFKNNGVSHQKQGCDHQADMKDKEDDGIERLGPPAVGPKRDQPVNNGA